MSALPGSNKSPSGLAGARGAAYDCQAQTGVGFRVGGGRNCGDLVAQRSAAGRDGPHGPWFARAKFRPAARPATLVARSALQERLAAGVGQRLTVVIGSAGAGKSVLLSSWAAARPPGATSWLSCDEADADPVRFWTGFLGAPRGAAAGFGADAPDLLAMDGGMSGDVTASIANDAGKLP